MLALNTPLKLRLSALPELTGWAVRTGSETVGRTEVPAVDVRCSGAAVSDSKTGAAMVQPEWAVTLIVRRSVDAADQIDAAFAAVVESLHNWAPGEHGERRWEPLRLVRVTEPQFADEGFVGCELSFSTGAKYDGQD
jgi:hypothetical protein